MDASELISRYGDSAYEEARTRARDDRTGRVIDNDRPPGHWDKVRAALARELRRAHTDTATRYLEC